MTCRTWVEELGSTLSLTWDIAGWMTARRTFPISATVFLRAGWCLAISKNT